ncbi:serine protease gd-like [Topomyia yanbarensis]|uniref:serine protease gd-like n=1 Tax=Topomyia yanbarensis TaxID=2498891 RepID=UPI00273BB1CC|nr:serine protease gd-like [Topomyia yanbarensis]
MTQVFHALALVLYLAGLSSIGAQYLDSPCPDVFTYQVDPGTNQIFGYIEINNIQVGQAAKLNVDLSIGAQLASDNVGSITLVKSREATFNDIVRGLPAQYRVNFPLQNILPTVLSISLNGQTLCTGYRAPGRVITTINLEHTLYTQLQPQNMNGFGFHRPPVTNSVGFQPQPQPQSNVPQPQPQAQPPLQTRPQWNYEPQTSRPPVYPTRPAVARPVVRPQTTTPIAIRTTPAPQVLTTSNRVCGKPSKSFLNKLSFNGELTEKGQFPWIVPLFDRTDQRDPKYFCGSTIITRKHLLTAAKCFYYLGELLSPERILAMPGMYNIDNFLDDNAKFADIEAVIPHEEYVSDDDLSDSNVAVLRLKKSLEFSDYISPICAWRGDNDLQTIVGENGVMAGWGVTETGSTSVATFIKMTVVDGKQCSENWSRAYPSTARVFCGDGHGSTPCIGDAGSGLVLKRGNQYYLRGILSNGQVDSNTLKCDVTKYAIFIDIAPFRFWLKTVTS